MAYELSPNARFWLEGVLGRLGMPEAQRHSCAATAAVQVGDVTIEFIQPTATDCGYVVARAMVGEVPPEGQCERLYQLLLNVQGMLCGPHTPVLGLDWPSRVLLVHSSLDLATVSYDDGASVLCSLNKVALHWREALTEHNVSPMRFTASVTGLAHSVAPAG